ncbi:hypothetical protein BD408DRAFT_413455 [Parasitella parasitica]|nr:hypothetical protein BD408DRAFT_413455 [Parasitella parasitica]
MTVKGSYYDPDGNSIHFFPVGETFGICPVPDFTKHHLEMISQDSVDADSIPFISKTIQDVLQMCALSMKMSTYQYLAYMQNTQYLVIPIHTKNKQDKFWALYTQLKSVNNIYRAKPDFVKMAKEWCRSTNIQNQALSDGKIPVDFYKIPELLESFFNKSQNNDIYVNTTKISKNAKLAATKNAVNPENRPDVVINSAVPLSSLRNIFPHSSRSNIPTKRPPGSPTLAPKPIIPHISLYPSTITIKKRKIGGKRCFTCEQRDPNSIYICPGKQNR